MKNNFAIGGKIGYLNLRTGKYKYVPIIGIIDDGFKMREERRQHLFGNNYQLFVNEYEEKIDNVIKYLKTPSIDFTDGRTLLKYKEPSKIY